MSGIQFSSPVTNQKASPAVYASSLATRPAPQLPGRIFVDTDNPSTGMYRDTGTVWVQLSSGSGTVPDLQTVCNVGFLTDTDMTFLYENSLSTSKIGFLNQDVGDFAFDIFKKANELFSIRALKPSTVDEEMEIIFDAPNNTIKTSYNSIIEGLQLDFAKRNFYFGNDWQEATNLFGWFGMTPYEGSQQWNIKIKDTVDFNRIFNQIYNSEEGFSSQISDGASESSGFSQSNGQFYYSINSNTYNSIVQTLNESFYVSIINNSTSVTTSFFLDGANQRLEVSNNLKSATAGGNSGQHLKIRVGGTDYKIQLLNP